MWAIKVAGAGRAPPDSPAEAEGTGSEAAEMEPLPLKPTIGFPMELDEQPTHPNFRLRPVTRFGFAVTFAMIFASLESETPMLDITFCDVNEEMELAGMVVMLRRLCGGEGGAGRVLTPVTAVGMGLGAVVFAALVVLVGLVIVVDGMGGVTFAVFGVGAGRIVEVVGRFTFALTGMVVGWVTGVVPGIIELPPLTELGGTRVVVGAVVETARGGMVVGIGLTCMVVEVGSTGPMTTEFGAVEEPVEEIPTLFCARIMPAERATKDRISRNFVLCMGI